MTKEKKITLVVIIALVLIIAVVAVLVMKNSSDDENGSGGQSLLDRVSDAVSGDKELTIKHLGIELAPYDLATKTAGDIKFTDIKLEQNRLFFDYGFEVPANSIGAAKKNPQPTFIVPLGTKVHAIVDGVVVSVPKLYSNDYSVQVAASKESQTIYETEHVINVLVKEGDTVKAGDVIAEVSDYDTRNTPGFGLVEIGILEAGNPPSHICPFEHLDPEFKKEVDANLMSLYEAWNDYKGETIYDTTDLVMPGCLTTEKIEG